MSKAGKILYLLSGISIASFGVTRFIIGDFIPFLWVPIGLFVLFLFAAIWSDRAVLKSFMMMKTTKHGMNMGAMILMVLVFLISVNFIAVRHKITWDFSAAKVNTLSEQSVKILKTLDAELTVRYFYKKGAEGVDQNKALFRELVKKYQDQSSQVKLDFVEVNERPDLAEEYGVNKGTGVVFVDYKKHRNRIEKIEEQELTSALVKVTRENDKMVYFLSGHGERDLENTQEAEGGAALKNLLEGNRYKVNTLTLANTATVPPDADMLFVVGPEQALLESEVQAIEEYMKRGGSVVFAFDSHKSNGLEKVLKNVGVEVANNYIVIVMDTIMGKAVNPSATPVAQFSNVHPVTKVFGKNQFVVFRLPTGLTKAASVPAGIDIEEILKTNEKSVGFSNTQFNQGGTPGPYTVGMSLKGKYPGATEGKEFSLLVFGNSTFLSNQLLYQNLNRDLVLNSVAYLAKDENLISISPKEVEITQMNITPGAWYLFVFGFIIPLPIALFGFSSFLWFKRRYA